MQDKTDFGFKQVNKSEKASLVGEVFTSVASKYDVMNDAMSLGVHRLWKNKFIEMLSPRPKSKLLDVAGGTGDIAFRFLKKSPLSEVVVFDINKEMLAAGKDRAIDKGVIENIEWMCGDAQTLPFEDNMFDYYTIAFGIRNVTDISLALKEAYRVLKPGGRFLCLEFSQVTHEALRKIYDCYSFNVIPKLGGILANDSDSYQYLIESIRKFPKQKEFLKMIEESGFSQCSYKNLSGGMVAVHGGWKI